MKIINRDNYNLLDPTIIPGFKNDIEKLYKENPNLGPGIINGMDQPYLVKDYLEDRGIKAIILDDQNIKIL